MPKLHIIVSSFPLQCSFFEAMWKHASPSTHKFIECSGIKAISNLIYHEVFTIHSWSSPSVLVVTGTDCVWHRFILQKSIHCTSSLFLRLVPIFNGVRTCPSDDITPSHTDVIDMVGINVGEELDAKLLLMTVTLSFLLEGSLMCLKDSWWN